MVNNAEMKLRSAGIELPPAMTPFGPMARGHLGSLDRVLPVMRIGVYIAAAREVTDHAKTADAASELVRDIFGVESLPFGLPVELEVIFEVLA